MTLLTFFIKYKLEGERRRSEPYMFKRVLYCTAVSNQWPQQWKELLLLFSYLEKTTFCFWFFNHSLSTQYHRCLPSSSAARDAPLAAELSRATALRRRIVKQVSSAPHGPVDLGSCHAPAPAYPAPQLLPVLSTVARWPNFGHVTEKGAVKNCEQP